MVFNLTRTQFEAKRKQLQQNGVPMPAGDTGEIVYDGIHASFAFVEPNLQVTITKKPFGLTEGYIGKRLGAWFNA